MTVAAGLDRAALQAILGRTDPAALLVPARILRRVIKRVRSITGPGLQVPHRRCIVIGRDTLLRIASRNELGVPAERDLPVTLLLLEEMDPARLAILPPGEALREYWRLLFHARVHAELTLSRAAGKMSDGDLRERVVQIGRTDLDAAAAVLRQENMLLPPRDLATLYEEFAALYLELQHFEPRLLSIYFPLARFETIDAVLARDVDAAVLVARTRLEGADEAPADEAAADEHQETAVAPAEAGPPHAASFARRIAAAARSRRRGNLVRAALRSERAARVGDPSQRAEARGSAAADLDQLMARLHKALELPPAEVAVWRQTLGALLGPAAGGHWTAEGRLLYDLQKICLDDEREVYAVDLVEWVVTAFRRPLRRHLPHQRHVLVLKHLRSAEGRLPAVRLPEALRGQFGELLHGAVRRGEDRLRDRFRPGARAALDGVGLAGRNRAECVSRDKIVEELLDRVVERNLLTMGDLRDAIARNRVKLPDLEGAGQFLFGDRLIRGNRALARNLDGVYRRGEIYLRWLQRLISVAFGTLTGRTFTLYFALPFGGAFFLIEAFKAIRSELPGHHSHREHDTTWLAEHLYKQIDSIVVLGLFLLAVLHLPALRQGLLTGMSLGWRWLRALFIDLPAFVLRLPAVQRVLQSRAYVLLYLFVLKPLAWAALATLALSLGGADLQFALAVGVGVFFVTGLLLNSPLGSHVEELLADRLVRGWHLLSRDLLPGLYYLVVGIFRALTERLERMLYAVDEWLRFRTGDSPLSATLKPLLGLAWFVVAYAVRAVINLFVEPTFNPIKHFPVVTVAAKLLLPFIPTLAPQITTALSPVLGVPVAAFLAGAVLFFIPGFAGFLVWELKENWRLYEANQPQTLRPEIVGSHGETVRRLLRPGFHSGTVPKLFAKLRHAEGKAARKHEQALHHVAEALKRFVQRDLLAILEDGSRLGDALRLRPGEVELGTNRIRFELRWRDVAGPPLCVDIDEEGGRLLAGVVKTGWLPGLAEAHRPALADALAGFYHLAGVDLVREEVEALLPPGTSYVVTETSLVAWPAFGEPQEVVYQLMRETGAAPSEVERLLLSQRPIAWADWVDHWERDGAKPFLPAVLARGSDRDEGEEARWRI
jgi:hypothetical protein